MIISRTIRVADTVKPAKRTIRKDISLQAYREFIRQKVTLAKDHGIEFSAADVNPICKPHQVDSILWMARGGRRAAFEAFGLGKTVIQIETLRLILSREPGLGLIVVPLGVRQEFLRDAAMLGVAIRFIQSDEEIKQAALLGDERIFLTNYESVREGKVSPAQFTAATLDEAAILRSFGGTLTYREFMDKFPAVKYRFICTATPDPNEYIELLAYAAFLGIMDVSQAKTMFFKRDSTKADKLTLHPHREEAFWNWVASWAIFLQKPSDLGYDDAGYALPELEVIKHEITVDETPSGSERDGQFKMFRDVAGGIGEAAREKRQTIAARVNVMQDILDAEPAEHFLIWHDLEAERAAIEKTVPDVVSVYGSQDDAEKESAIIDFAEGRIKHLASKAVMLGAGCNFQRHCARAIFLGLTFKFYQWIQAIHRIHRFLQDRPVKVHLIYASTERRVLENLMKKWDRYKEQVKRIEQLIQKYGLSQRAMIAGMSRTDQVERREVSAESYRLVLNDVVQELPSMADNSVDLILTSIPFSTQYEYSPSLLDFGHTESNAHFFEQMDFVTPHLLRVLKPGRLCCIHVKDRIVPGGLTGLGFQVVYPLHADCLWHYQAHGFGYMGMKTIVTDVVRENNQTYRLGWTEQCKDGTKMGVGMPEYLLIFRKPPSETDRSYADSPVIKSKKEYTRGRWQIDAHGFERSNGNRPLAPEDLIGLPHHVIFKLFRKYSEGHVYDYENHVKLAESLDERHLLPVTFMLLQPASWSDDVWTDITRMRTLNMLQAQKGRQMHLCPMQFDIAKRVIQQYSMPGETVFDPFSGLMTVPMVAVTMGRNGFGVELSPLYFQDGCRYVALAAEKAKTPTLLDLVEADS